MYSNRRCKTHFRIIKYSLFGSAKGILGIGIEHDIMLDLRVLKLRKLDIVTDVEESFWVEMKMKILLIL